MNELLVFDFLAEMTNLHINVIQCEQLDCIDCSRRAYMLAVRSCLRSMGLIHRVKPWIEAKEGVHYWAKICPFVQFVNGRIESIQPLSYLCIHVNFLASLPAELRALCMPARCSIAQLQFQPISPFKLKDLNHSVSQAGLELVIALSQLPESWAYRPETPA